MSSHFPLWGFIWIGCPSAKAATTGSRACHAFAVGMLHSFGNLFDVVSDFNERVLTNTVQFVTIIHCGQCAENLAAIPSIHFVGLAPFGGDHGHTCVILLPPLHFTSGNVL